MQLQRKILFLLLSGIVCVLPRVTEAQITVDRSIFYWKQPSPPVQNISVRNSAEQPMFVEIKSEEVIEPGTASERRELAKDMIVAPKRFSVPAKGERVVRLLRKGTPGEAERVFRISFIPQSIEPTEEERTSAGQTSGRLQTSLKVLSGVGILIFLEPATLAPKLITERDSDKVFLRNAGNVNILISKIQKCSQLKENCEPLAPKRLYPGNSLEVTGVSGKAVIFTKRIGDEFTEETIE